MDNFRKSLLDSLEADAPQDLLKLIFISEGLTIEEQMSKVILKLGSVAKSDFTDEISTAAIGFENSGIHIWFNKEFLRENIQNPYDLLFILCHELMHHIKGDIFRRSRPGRDRHIWNFSCDMVINAHLVKHCSAEFSNFLDRFYGKSPLPFILLCPGSIEFTRQLTEENCDTALLSLVSDLTSTGWESDASLIQIYELVESLFNFLYGHERRPEILKMLIGGHSLGEDEYGCDQKWNEWFKRNVLGAGFSMGDSDIKVKEHIVVREKKSIQFYEIIKKAISPDNKHQALREMLIPEKGFVPTPGRKETFLLSSGYLPMFYPNPVTKKDMSEWRPIIYIDVSGSTSEYWPLIYGLLLNIKEYIGSPVYIFSERVEEISFEELANGLVFTQYGTNFDPVIEHILKKKYKRALIISDGNGRLTHDLENMIKDKVELFCISTDNMNWNVFVGSIGGAKTKNIRWWSLPEIVGKY